MTIAADNTITILCPTSEMGQGVLTALPLILAEELDADWSKVKCEFAPGNPRVYGGAHKMFPGAQVPLASVSVPAYYMPLRMAGAQARKVLVDAVAAEWKVPAERTDHRTVSCAKNPAQDLLRRGGEVRQGAAATAAEDGRSGSQEAEDFKLIGRKDIKRVDVPSKVNGSANTASTCRCRAWSMPRCCTRRWKA